MTIRLSHSARQKYEHCARLYRLHYLDKVRPLGSTSALLFGSAIDKACENYMIEKNALKAREMFKQTWRDLQDGFIEEDGTTTAIEYHNNDFDHELLLQSDNQLILDGAPFVSVKDLVEVLKDPELITSYEEKARLAYAQWVSMYRKGIMLVNKFIEWVDENVEEMLEAQTEIELEDEDGNKVTGKADFVIKIHGYDNPILVDLKTTARFYERGSVKESEQLALYYLYFKNTKYPTMERAAFLVLNKMIKKNRTKTCKKCGTVTTGREKTCAVGTAKNRCHGEFDEVIDPQVNLQYIHDEIPQEFIDATIQKFNLTKEAIQAGNFEKNLEGCHKYYGRECPYKKYCESGCMTGLIKKEDK
jgi:hypothetical protein